MAKVNSNSYYSKPHSYLQQGDIFRIDLVAPAADVSQRIFRTEDGRHGSLVFEENCRGRVFDRQELDALLEDGPHTEFFTKPFHATPDGQEEMVVVFSRLFQYFTIATQTCDISGKDKGPVDWATILPVITLTDMCKTELIPFRSTDQILTIHEFVSKYCETSGALENLSDMDYVPELKKIINECAKEHTNKAIRQDAGHVKNYLASYYKPLFIFSLPADNTFGLPESYVDFTAAYTVHTSKLLAIRDSRFAMITDPYRIDFAQKFGNFFARVALPRPMRPT